MKGTIPIMQFSKGQRPIDRFNKMKRKLDGLPFPLKRDFGFPVEKVFDNLREFAALPKGEFYPARIFRIDLSDTPLRPYQASSPEWEFPNHPECITSINSDYFTANVISEYFQEPVRIQAHRKGVASPESYWTSPKLRHYVLRILSKRHNHTVPLTIMSVRQAIDEATRKTCDHFAPTIIIDLMRIIEFRDADQLDLLNARVLDICAGWGDRALACAALGVREYIGFDPNKALTKGYDEIAEFVAKQGSETKITMHYEKAQDLSEFIHELDKDQEKEPEKIDIVLAFPPYFDAENYCEDKTQSSHEFPRVKDWVNKFLKRSLENAWNELRPGGFLIFNVNDVFSRKMRKVLNYTSDVAAWIQDELHGVLMEKLVFTTQQGGAPQPLFIYRKPS